jgi:hypothetical protein
MSKPGRFNKKEKDIIPSSPLNGWVLQTSRVSDLCQISTKKIGVQKEGKDIFMSKGKTKKVHGVSSKVEKEKEEKRDPSVHHENACRGRQK